MIEFNDGIIDEIKNAVNEALEEGAECIAEESKRQAPEDTGALKESCRIEDTGDMQAEVIYGADYAAKVHEDMNMHYKTGKAKFLEDAFNELAEGIAEKAGKVFKE